MNVTAEVRPSAFAARPYQVVFKHNDTVFAEWPVATVKAAEQRIAETLSAIAATESVREQMKRAKAHIVMG